VSCCRQRRAFSEVKDVLKKLECCFSKLQLFKEIGGWLTKHRHEVGGNKPPTCLGRTMYNSLLPSASGTSHALAKGFCFQSCAVGTRFSLNQRGQVRL
jgi:hypothetical protein